MGMANAAQQTSSAILGKLTGTGVKMVHSTVTLGMSSGNAYFKVVEVADVDSFYADPQVFRTSMSVMSGSTTSGTLIAFMDIAKFTGSGAYNEYEIKMSTYGLGQLSGAGTVSLYGLGEARTSGQSFDVVTFGR